MTNRKIDIEKARSLPLPSIKTLSINLIFALVLGFLGPFGSYQIPFIKRLLYWIILFNIGYFIYIFSHRIVDSLFSNKNLHPAFLYMAPSLLATFPLAFIVVFATQFVQPHYTITFTMVFYILPHIFILGIIIDTIMRLIHRNPEVAIRNKQQLGGQLFINRLPNEVGEQLICLSMEDHYILVHTKIGSHMLLMRMKDALIELKEYPGLQVHRSHWVAKNQIEKVNKTSRKVILLMRNGLEIPVSRKFYPEIKALGFI